MNLLEKLHLLHRLLSAARLPVSWQRILDELRCSESTAQRLLNFLEYTLGAPIERNARPRTYRYTNDAFQLPSLWFTDVEIYALLAMEQILESLPVGLLKDVLAPMRKFLIRLMKARGLEMDQQHHRIRLIRATARAVGRFFGEVATGVLRRRHLDITYTARSTGETTDRQVSPQRLTHYRDNWYLDAWCHSQNGLRTFALERISRADVLETTAIDVDEEFLDRKLGSSYGIMSGEPTATAVLHFAAQIVPWVAEMKWHPNERGTMQEDGSYILEIPYHRAEELILHIMQYGSKVKVLGPPELVTAVHMEHRTATAQYE